MFYFIPLEKSRVWLLVLIVLAYTFLAVRLQTAGHPTSYYEYKPWNWWPAICVLGVMCVAAATDHFSRSIKVKLYLIAGAMFVYAAVMLPLMLWLGAVILHPERGDASHAAQDWALMRAYAGYPMVILSMRSSWLLLKRGKAGPAASHDIELSQAASKFVRERVGELLAWDLEALDQLPARADEEIRIADEWMSAASWREAQDDGSHWIVVQVWQRGLRDRTVAAAGFALDSGARRTLSDAELREGGFL